MEWGPASMRSRVRGILRAAPVRLAPRRNSRRCHDPPTARFRNGSDDRTRWDGRRPAEAGGAKTNAPAEGYFAAVAAGGRSGRGHGHHRYAGRLADRRRRVAEEAL